MDGRIRLAMSILVELSALTTSAREMRSVGSCQENKESLEV